MRILVKTGANRFVSLEEFDGDNTANGRFLIRPSIEGLNDGEVRETPVELSQASGSYAPSDLTVGGRTITVPILYLSRGSQLDAGLKLDELKALLGNMDIELMIFDEHGQRTFDWAYLSAIDGVERGNGGRFFTCNLIFRTSWLAHGRIMSIPKTLLGTDATGLRVMLPNSGNAPCFPTVTLAHKSNATVTIRKFVQRVGSDGEFADVEGKQVVFAFGSNARAILDMGTLLPPSGSSFTLLNYLPLLPNEQGGYRFTFSDITDTSFGSVESITYAPKWR